MIYKFSAKVLHNTENTELGLRRLAYSLFSCL